MIGKPRHDDNEDALMALAAHRGDVAFDGIANLARNAPDAEARKHAIFWMAVADGSRWLNWMQGFA